MEVESATSVFKRSFQSYDIWNIKYLGDGDSKGFNPLTSLNIYGSEYPMPKFECIGHVMKIMRILLRRLKGFMKNETVDWKKYWEKYDLQINWSAKYKLLWARHKTKY